MCRLANEIGPFVVGPISVDAFLQSFLPPPIVPLVSPFTAGMFNPLIDLLSEPESKYYNVFVSFDPYRPTLTAPVLGSNLPLSRMISFLNVFEI